MTTGAWAKSEISKLTSWITRKRSLGLGLVFAACTLLTALASGGFSVEVHGILGVVNAFKFSTGDGLTGSLLSLAAYLAVGLALLGGYIVFSTWRVEQQHADLNRVVAVELRGLVDTTDHPLKASVPANLPGRRVDGLIDVRQLLTGSTPNVPEALEEISHLRRRLRSERASTSREHIKVVAGGVLQVPLLFFAGTLLEDEGKTTLLDWERTTGCWRELTDIDDGSRFVVKGIDQIGQSTEAVVAVSASYEVDHASIAETFPGKPVVHLAKANPLPNTLWSELSQAGLTQQFIETLAALSNQGVQMVHLVLAAPSSLSLRFGMAYDHRNMPNLRCYQREKDQVPPYPWSIQMPTATQPVAFMSTSRPAVVTA